MVSSQLCDHTNDRAKGMASRPASGRHLSDQVPPSDLPLNTVSVFREKAPEGCSNLNPKLRSVRMTGPLVPSEDVVKLRIGRDHGDRNDQTKRVAHLLGGFAT